MENSSLTTTALTREMPTSETIATLEVLSYHGVTRNDLSRIRRDKEHARLVCDYIKGYNMSWVQDWLWQLVLRQVECQALFFGRTFDLTPFITTLKSYGHKLVKYWRRLDFEPVFLPKVMMSSDVNYPGWKIKPEKWLYQQSVEGQLFRLQNNKLVVSNSVFELEGITALVDTRLKPKYDNGRQMYQNDCFEPVILRLRSNGKLTDYTAGPQGSRFGTSADDEWEQVLKPAGAELLKLPADKIRFERAIEANVIPQLYYNYMPRNDDGTTETSVWYEEFFQSRDHRLSGGDSAHGGLASVSYGGGAFHWRNRSVRFLAVL